MKKYLIARIDGEGRVYVLDDIKHGAPVLKRPRLIVSNELNGMKVSPLWAAKQLAKRFKAVVLNASIKDLKGAIEYE